MVVPCRHEVPNSSGRRCALFGAYRDIAIAIEGPRATCRDCAKTFVGW